MSIFKREILRSLVEARARIAPFEAFLQDRSWGKKAHPLERHINFDEADCFCAMGALGPDVYIPHSAAELALDRVHYQALHLFGRNRIFGVNDDSTTSPEKCHINVLRCYDAAIQKLEAELRYAS